MAELCPNTASPDQNKLFWYALYVKPRSEFLVATLLKRYDQLSIFLPEVKQQGDKKGQLLPLFPRYLFVQLDIVEVPMSLIKHTPGVISLVGNQEEPIPISHQIIDALQEYIITIDKKGGQPQHTFADGDTVVFKEGPFQGLEAIFVGSLNGGERVQVLLDILGHEQRVETDVFVLEKGSDMPKRTKVKQVRRTRGRGRRGWTWGSK